MKCPFEMYEIVIVKGYPKGDINHKAMIHGLYPEEGKVWIANGNMPFLGTLSEKVPYDAVEKVIKID